MNKELYAYMKDNKDNDLSEKYIYDVFEMLLREDDDLKDYIKDFRIDSTIEGLGDYSNDSRLIRINPVATIESPILYEDKKISVIQVLMHEIEHARNLRRLYRGRNDIESLVTRYSLVDYIKKHNLGIPLFTEEKDFSYLNFHKHENYLYDPGERLADIKSCKYMVNLLKNQRNTQSLLMARNYLYYAYVRGYKDNKYYLDAPTYTFLSNMGMFREQYLLKKVIDVENYSLVTRATCGLPITYNEHDEVILKKVRLQRRKNT